MNKKYKGFTFPDNNIFSADRIIDELFERINKHCLRDSIIKLKARLIEDFFNNAIIYRKLSHFMDDDFTTYFLKNFDIVDHHEYDNVPLMNFINGIMTQPNIYDNLNYDFNIQLELSLYFQKRNFPIQFPQSDNDKKILFTLNYSPVTNYNEVIEAMINEGKIIEYPYDVIYYNYIKNNTDDEKQETKMRRHIWRDLHNPNKSYTRKLINDSDLGYLDYGMIPFAEIYPYFTNKEKRMLDIANHIQKEIAFNHIKNNPEYYTNQMDIYITFYYYIQTEEYQNLLKERKKEIEQEIGDIDEHTVRKYSFNNDIVNELI